MATLEFQRIGFLPGTRDARVLDWLGHEATEALSGRTIWAVGFEPEAPAFAERIEDVDLLAGGRLTGDDLVLLHDPLAGELAPAVREHGAHALWLSEGASPSARTPGVDAYLMAWRSRRGPGGTLTVAALVPAVGMLAARQIALEPEPERRERVVWDSLLAEVLDTDRHECVGGTFHVRPIVAAR